MTDRAALTNEFLARAGWADARREPLAGDASRRRYKRLLLDGRSAVLMDAPASEDVGRFIAIARHLAALGFRAPQIYAEDEASHLLLLEDLGDGRYGRLIDQKPATVAPRILFGAAVDVLIELHRQPAPAYVTTVDEVYLAREAELFVEWWLVKHVEGADAEALHRGYDEAWREIRPLALAGPHALALRDFHADNLMWLPEASGEGKPNGADGVSRVGVLDFQDAVCAPVAYDLVSLLQDARRDIPAELAEAMITHYLAAFPALDAAAFRASYAALGAHRNLRIVGVFSRLGLRDGKTQYLRHMPRVWRLVEHNLAHPALAPLKAWLDRAAPLHVREPTP